MSARIEDLGDRLIVWNRAEKRGALSPEFYELVIEAMAQAAAPRVRAVILTGAGEFFCAGGDLNVLIERSKLSLPERHEKIDGLHNVVRALRASPVPVIAAIEGGAAGAGLSLALACDLITAAQDAKFTAAYVKAGLVPDGGLTTALARMLPRPLAMEMCLLGRPVTAKKLAALGVVTELTETGESLGAAQVLADQFAKGPRQAQGEIRRLVSDAYEAREADQLDAEQGAMARAQGGEEAAEGIAAFLQKRKADFS